jgi:hypothetical protein
MKDADELMTLTSTRGAMISTHYEPTQCCGIVRGSRRAADSLAWVSNEPVGVRLQELLESLPMQIRVFDDMTQAYRWILDKRTPSDLERRSL